MAASSRAQVLDLYRVMLRESGKFTSYNYRTYAIRRIREAFRENKNVKDSAQIQMLVNKAKRNLEIIRRQVPWYSWMSELQPTLVGQQSLLITMVKSTVTTDLFKRAPDLYFLILNGYWLPLALVVGVTDPNPALASACIKEEYLVLFEQMHWEAALEHHQTHLSEMYSADKLVIENLKKPGPNQVGWLSSRSHGPAAAVFAERHLPACFLLPLTSPLKRPCSLPIEAEKLKNVSSPLLSKC